MTKTSTEASRAQRALSVGVVLFRWGSYAWMVALALTASGHFAHPWVAWSALAIIGIWTAWASVPRVQAPWGKLWVELGLAIGLVVVSGYVLPHGGIVDRQFFAAAWPIAVVIAWGVARGPIGGLSSAIALSGALIGSRALNHALITAQTPALINGSITYILGGATVGIVARTLERSAEESQRLIEETVVATDRAARLAERESLARQIHDSVLQALSMIHKRARELAERSEIRADEVAALARMAASQEEALRALILREPEAPPSGTASLRTELEKIARAHHDPPVSVSAVGPIWLDAHAVNELVSAVKQALDNVAEHAAAATITVFAESDAGWVSVSVRDDGRGFVYDEDVLRADGKAGMLKSMKGRVESLGGRMFVTSAAGRGTEIEFRIPSSR
ncbi:MAG: ATP-binding protein [Actinomycetota bacterium]